MSVLHKGMAAGLIALTLSASSLTTATPAQAGSDDEFWGGVAAGAVGGILLSQAVRPGYYYDYPAYGPYYRPYYYRPYHRPYYRSYYRPYRSYYRPYGYYRPYYRPYYRSYYRPYYRPYYGIYGSYYRHY